MTIKITAQLYRWNSTGQRCPKTQSDPTGAWIKQPQRAAWSGFGMKVWFCFGLCGTWSRFVKNKRCCGLRRITFALTRHPSSGVAAPLAVVGVEDVKRISWVLWLLLICFCAAPRRIRSRRKAFIKDTFWVNVWQITLSSYPPNTPSRRADFTWCHQISFLKIT